jgi:CHAT domain-containing protein
LVHRVPLLAAGALLALLCGAGTARAGPAGGDAATVAAAAHEAGRYEEALAQWEDALAAAGRARDDGARAQALLGAATAYLALGRPNLALERLAEAAPLAAAGDGAALGARITAATGSAQQLAGRTDEARATFERALAQAEEAGQPALVARVANDYANLLAARGERDRATAAYRRGLDAARVAGDAAMTAQLAVNHARSLYAAGQKRQAAALLATAEETARALPASHARSAVLVSVARLQQAHGDGKAKARAVANLDLAAASAREAGDRRTLAYALGYRAELADAAGEPARALALSHDASRQAQHAGAPESAFRWQWQSARLLRDGGKADDAIAAYRVAVASAGEAGRDLASAGASVGFRERIGGLYVEYVDLLLGRAQRARDPAAAQADLEEARRALELLKRAELADYYEDACVARLAGETRGVEGLGAATAAIYPVVLPDRLAVLVVLPGGLRLHTAPVGAAAVDREVQTLRRTLEKRTSREYLAPARRVYDWLIRPVERELAAQGIDTLVFVPDGALRTVPLAALHDGTSFLVTRFAVATSPGLSLTDPRPARRAGGRTLIGALSESVQGFPALPAVVDEVATLRAQQAGTVLSNDAFQAQRFQQEIARGAYSVVHVASHGEFGRQEGDTYLLTHDGRITLGELEARLGGSAYRARPVDLLVLSACQTAAGDDRSALGLGGVAVKAGVRSSLATLWSVSDRASTLLVTEFYRGYADPGVTKARALQQAQQRLLADARYRHPAYWGAFLLIGNWQ